jgi:SAM-dependent methyltransferase
MTVRTLPHHTTSRLITQTLRVYDRDAQVFLARWGRPRYTRPALLAEWMRFLPRRGTLLDLGCGAAQDARYLTTRGHRVIGLDRAWPLLRFGRRRDSSLPLILADIRHLPLRPGRLDGIWAAASLMHLPKKNLAHVLLGLRDLVQHGGVLGATLTHGVKSRIRKDGWMPGRYFARWKKQELAQAFHRAGWDLVSLRVVVSQERKGRWINVIARRAD